MSAPWELVRRRYRLVEEVLADVDRDGLDALRGWDAAIGSEYDGEDPFGGFLADVQRRWQRAFDARLDGVLEDGGSEPRDAVVALWEALADRHRAARLVLDAHAGHPALDPGRRRHRLMLLAATGVDLDDVQPDLATQPSIGEHHGREHRARRGLLRLRPVCARLHRGPVPTAGAAPRVRAGA